MSAVLDRVQSRRRPGYPLGQVRREVLTWFAERHAEGIVIGDLVLGYLSDEWGRGVDPDVFDAQFARLVELCDRHADLGYGFESARCWYGDLPFDEAREACLEEIEEVLDVLVPKAVT